MSSRHRLFCTATALLGGLGRSYGGGVKGLETFAKRVARLLGGATAQVANGSLSAVAYASDLGLGVAQLAQLFDDVLPLHGRIIAENRYSGQAPGRFYVFHCHYH